MRITLKELAEFGKLRDLEVLVPQGVKVEVVLHSSQERGNAEEGPWHACTIIADGFKSEHGAKAFWNAVAWRFKIGLNSVTPYNRAASGDHWRMEILLNRDDVARIKTG